MATPATSMVFEQGMRVIPLGRSWSTMIINESCSFEGGKSLTRSTESCLKGRDEDNGMGANGGERDGHTAQPEMKALTNDNKPGHQKSHSNKTSVLKCPACPVVGESCIECTMACCSCGGIYIQPLKYRWLLVIWQSFLKEQGKRKEPC